MKKIYGLAALSAAMLLASCSNNDEPIIGGQTGPSMVAATGYISINIMDAQSTRADYTHEFSIGSEDESKITKGCVVCFDADGKFVYYADLTNTNFTYNKPVGADQNIESTKESVIEVKQLAAQPIKQMITVLNMTGSELGLTNPTENTDGTIQANTGSMEGGKVTVETVRKQLADLATNRVTAGKFVMSNAIYNKTTDTYNDAGEKTGSVTKPNYTIPVEAYSDFAEAGNKKVDVYVERVAAKLTYKVNEVDDEASFTNNGIYTTTGNEGNNFVIDGKPVAQANALPIVVTGIAFANVPQVSYLVKDLGTTPASDTNFTTGFKTEPKFNWNDPDNYRSHWGLVADVNSSKTYWDDATKDANGAYTNNAGKLFFETYSSWNTITNANTSFDITTVDSYKYIQENTNAKAPTCILLTAYIDAGKRLDASGNEISDANGKAIQKDIYRAVVNGKYYTEDNIKDAYVGYLIGDKYLKKVYNEDTQQYEYKSLAATDLKIIKSTDSSVPSDCPKDDYSGYIQIDADNDDLAYIYTDAATNEAIEATKTAVATVNQNLIKKTIDSQTPKKDTNGNVIANTYVQLHKYRVYKWAGGKCYYFKNIEAEQVGKAGVVRNHLYKLTLNGVQGMGVPVFNPTTKIIPETPDPVDPKEPTTVFINTTIDVLSWTLYTQGITFE